jgi:hypothetical protein
VVGISEIIIKPGLVNVDFADVRTIMGNAGTPRCLVSASKTCSQRNGCLGMHSIFHGLIILLCCFRKTENYPFTVVFPLSHVLCTVYTDISPQARR